MIDSRQVEGQFSRVIGRRLGFGALSQVVGRNAIAFLREYVVPAAKCVGVELFELAAPKVAEVAGGKKIFKTAAR